MKRYTQHEMKPNGLDTFLNTLDPDAEVIAIMPVTVTIGGAAQPGYRVILKHGNVLTHDTTPGLFAIIAERDRQIRKEGFDRFHDDHHGEGELAMAAACYAENSVDPDGSTNPVPALWPWNDSWWKPSDRRRDLVKAGALILAEIERLDRESAGLTYKVDSPFEPGPGEHQEVLDAIDACNTGESDD